jgi:hypothetical protein
MAVAANRGDGIEASANAYLAGLIVAQLGHHPAVSEISGKQFDAIEALSAVTRGPLQG